MLAHARIVLFFPSYSYNKSLWGRASSSLASCPASIASSRRASSHIPLSRGISRSPHVFECAQGDSSDQSRRALSCLRELAPLQELLLPDCSVSSPEKEVEI
jgi:hypothetical protein